MRTAYLLGFFVLALVLLARGFIAWEETNEAAQQRGTYVQVISRGALLPASSELDLGDQVEAAIIAGDTVVAPVQAGLFGLRFDTAGHPGAKGAFEQSLDLQAFVDATMPGEFLALAQRGVIAAEHRNCARELGAEALLDDFKGSWAFVCARTESGWRALAETSSTTSGVLLATHLPSAAQRPVARMTESLRGQGTVTLTREAPQTSVALLHHVSHEFAGGAFEAWSGPAAETSFQEMARWEEIPMGRAPRLTLGLGLRTSGSGVRVRATISAGPLSESFPYDLPRERSRVWVPLEIDLRAFAGQSVDVSFEAATDGVVPGSVPEIFFARPTLSFSGE